MLLNLEQAMPTKLHINIPQGVVDVEGDPEFVREIYADFKDKLLNEKSISSRSAADEASSEEPPKKAKIRKRSRTRDRATTKEATTGPAIDSPKLDKNLDTRNLVDFFAQFAPRNNAEKILIYLKFIIEELNISAPNTDQVFTCFRETRQKIPEAFAHAFYKMSSRHGFIDIKSASDISITIAGENHFNDNLKRKDAE